MTRNQKFGCVASLLLSFGAVAVGVGVAGYCAVTATLDEAVRVKAAIDAPQTPAQERDAALYRCGFEFGMADPRTQAEEDYARVKLARCHAAADRAFSR